LVIFLLNTLSGFLLSGLLGLLDDFFKVLDSLGITLLLLVDDFETFVLR